jgi:ribonuclease HI
MESVKPECYTIYTDGSCSNNGKNYSKSGVAFIALNKNKELGCLEEIKNFCCKTVESHEKFFNDICKKPTNQKAELLAILEALDFSEKHLVNTSPGVNDKIIFVKTDSMYCVNIYTKWIQNWIRNDWKTANNKEVLNKHIIKAIHEKIHCLRQYSCKVVFSHVRAHLKNPGKSSIEYINWYFNDKVDKLAKSAEE